MVFGLVRVEKWLRIVAVLLLVAMIGIATAKAFAQQDPWIAVGRTQIEDNAVYLAALDVPLAGPAKDLACVADVDHSDAVREGDVEIDLSETGKGYVSLRYDGNREGFYVEVARIGADGYEESAHYNLPATGEWAGLVLPFGSGEYEMRAFPYDTATFVSEGWEQALFGFDTEFENEASAYRFENVYSKIDDAGLAPAMAFALAEREEAAVGRGLSALEKADAVVGFVFRTIADDPNIAEKRSAPGVYYIPDTGRTIAERKGSCADKAALAAVMLKSLDVPVRIHYGYIERKGDGGAYEQIYHAWLNVWDGAAWAMYDPSLVEGPVDDFWIRQVRYLHDTATVQ